MLKVVIVDDEEPSLDKLEKLLVESSLAEIIGRFTEPLEALDYLKNNRVDAVFLDIEMPDIDGIELSSRIIDLQMEAEIIFVTAYNQYAVEAFRLNALDYLMKPVTAGRLMDTLSRLCERRGKSQLVSGIKAECFGRFRAITPMGEVKFRTEKAEELLAFLIDRRGGTISRSEIIDHIWEDFDGDRAIIHFNTTLHYVKKAFYTYGSKITILYDRGSYRLELRDLDCDYLTFSQFTDREVLNRTDHITELEEIAGLYRGDYLAGWDYDWVEVKRLLLEEQYISLILRISELYKGIGNTDVAEKWLKEGLTREPLHRELNFRMIELRLLSNERSIAVRYYKLYREGLYKKMKKEPDEAFQRLIK